VLSSAPPPPVPETSRLTLREVARIPLPAHVPDGGFDHAAVHSGLHRLFVAHTSNDSVDVIDLRTRTAVTSIPSLPGVAGVWVSEKPALLFTSNRGEDTASVFDLSRERERFRLPTGHRPNGLAFDRSRHRLLVAGVGNPKTDAAPTATIFDVRSGEQLFRLPLRGRTRWATYHEATDSFYVNIADPPGIVAIDAGQPDHVDRFLDVPAVGPHGLEQDPNGTTLYCACDDGQLVTVDVGTGQARLAGRLSGAPDVVWLNRRLGHLYVAVGDPGTIDVFQTSPIKRLESVSTGEGAHTLTVDPASDEIHVFLPASHEDLVLGPAAVSR
jgi:DNA-binding beta-propeller fold protein YncE